MQHKQKKQEESARTYWEALGHGVKASETAPQRDLSELMGVMPASDIGSPACPEGFFQHVIRQGESLITIAQRYNISLTELMSYNPNINPYFYTTGQILCIPAANYPSCPMGTVYVVREGDTLYSIAMLYGTSVEAIQSANPGLDPLSLVVGQIICVPGTRQSRSCPEGYAFHTAQPIDTAVSLMREGSFSYGALTESNPSIDFLNLQAGELLCLPPSGSRGSCMCAEGGRAYRLGENESLSSVSQRFGVSEDRMVYLNPMLTPGDFAAGQIVCVPFE